MMCRSSRDKANERLELEIVEIRPLKTELMVEVRFKNVGDTIARVPWVATRKDVAESRDELMKGWVEGTLYLETKVQGLDLQWRSQSNLYSSESRPFTILELSPGTWATAIFVLERRCPGNKPCLHLPPHYELPVRARWSEYRYSVWEEQRCSITRSNLSVRRVKSTNVLSLRNDEAVEVTNGDPGGAQR
jgi:hypothetical protein